MDILKIATAGSVDVGKSTLIGRLLYDTNSVTKDKLDAVELSGKRKGLNFIDLSLLTDGLIAEREQNITIDVAHIYFSTAKRKYILADAPGHFEYIRNMITGASGAAAFIILVDAGTGVTEQTKRHVFIAALLEPGNVLVCINKMDLVDYNGQAFHALKKEMLQLARLAGYQGDLVFIPVVATRGDNIVTRSPNMKWYSGPTLLQYLDEIPVHEKDVAMPARMVVQLVIETGEYKGYACKVISGSFKSGDQVSVLPGMKQATIQTTWHATKEVETAHAGQSITICLAEEVSAVRGNTIVAHVETITASNDFTATICWLNEDPLVIGKEYLLQHNVHTTLATFQKVHHVVDIPAMEKKKITAQVTQNEIAQVQVHLAEPIFADNYHNNPANGAFIIIDPSTNNTVAAGFFKEL